MAWPQRVRVWGLEVAAAHVPWSRKARPSERAAFTRQLAGLVSAGVPLMQALEVIGRGALSAHWAAVVQALRVDVATGQSLAQSLRCHPGFFPALYVHLVGAGEAAGVLDSTLARLADQEEKAAALARQMHAALVYPVVVMVVALAVVVVLMVQVVPTFTDVFASFGAPLPPLTRMVIEVPAVVLHHGWWMVSLAVLAFLTARHLVIRSPQWRRALDAGLLRVPVWGPLLHRAVMARWTRALSTVFGAGLTVVQALSHAAQACGHEAVAQATLAAQQEVRTGEPLADSLARSGLFPPLVLQMVAIGESSGSLEGMLSKAADALDLEVDAAVKGLSSLVEPVMIVSLGAVIGTVVVAMYLPILQLGSIA